MSEHAKYSPSGASRWMTCPGSVAYESSLPDQSSSYADEGTAAHDLASQVLQARVDGDFSESGDPRNYVGRKIVSGEREFYVDEGMAGHVETYVTNAMIWSAKPNAMREVEQRVYFGAYLDASDEEAFGTVDFGAALLAEGEIQVHDFKYGMGVKVFAERNEQMMLYALGYLAKYELIADFTHARLVIHQPRLDHTDEWVVPIDDLLAFGEKAKAMVAVINGDFDRTQDGPQTATGYLMPTDKGCKFCKAKATCTALRAEVNTAVVSTTAIADDFTDLTDVPLLTDVPSDILGAAMDKIGLLEDFAKAVRAEVERRLFAFEPVDSPEGGYKLGMGKKGNRAWKDETAAEKLLKSFRLKNEDMYNFKLKGIPHFEKMLAKESPTRWKKVQALYGQSEGKPSVMRMDDPRPAITQADAALGFDDLTGVES